MLKASVFIAASLDGFIAREDGRIDWLSDIEEIPGEDFGYKQFIDSIDCIVMGRNTFETVLSFEHWPYEKPIYVITTRAIDLPKYLEGKVFMESGEPEEITQRLGERGYRHLYIDGGRTIQGFLQAGLIQEIIISWIPVLIGKGIPLFGITVKDIKLELIESQSYSNGIVQCKYALGNS